MNSLVDKYLSWSYLSGISPSPWYNQYLLYFAIFVTVLPILVKTFFKIKKRSKAYIKFDYRWFWGYLSLGLVGIFLWFATSQKLPTLGMRLMVFIWLASLLAYVLYLFIYFQQVTVRDIQKFHEKKRKEKYLK